MTARARDLRNATVGELFVTFDDPSLAVRMRALDELTDRLESSETRRRVEEALRDWCERKSVATGVVESDRYATMLLWAMARLTPSSLGDQVLRRRPLPRVPLLQALAAGSVDVTVVADSAEVVDVTRVVERYAVESLSDVDPFVVRAAVHLLGRKPSLATLPPLVTLFARAPAEDAMLRHAIKLALRSHLELPHALDHLDDLAPDSATFAALVELGLALHGEAAGRFLIDHAKAIDDPERLAALLEHAAREAAPRDLPRLVATIRDRFAGARATQLSLMKTLVAGAEARGVAPDPAIAGWAEAIVGDVVAAEEAAAPPWREAPIAGAGKSANPWCLQERVSADGVAATFLSTLPRGEKRTGALRSPPFAAPKSLSCWLAGHNGETDRDAIPFNKVRVRDAASDALIAEALAPRNDVAQQVVLDLAAAAGRAVVVELVDANPYDAYAWLAAGRFEPQVVTLPLRSPAEASDELADACTVAGRFRDGALDAALAKLLRARGADPTVRAAAAAALLARGARASDSALAALLDDPDAPRELLEPIAEAIAARDTAALDSLAARAVELCPSRQQLALATAWARTPEGAKRLVEQVRAGKAAPALLAKPELREAIVASWPEEGAAQVDALTAGLASDDEARAALLADRRRSFARYGGDAAKGAAHFAKNCVACHAIGGVGATIGPQLDGLSARGFERVLEDLLDPGRNVDPQFARTNLFLKGGDVRSLLVRRREPNHLVVVDEHGTETTLPIADLEKEKPSRFSLMPDNFGELLGEEETRDLLAWLIAAR
jgi:putative heme-binding domain-containing protein